MKIIIVRHGETYENKEKIIQGWSVGTLNQEGIEQAKKVALRLKNEKIDVCYCSDLDRTMKTAQEIMKYHPNISLIPEKALRERKRGKWEGKPREPFLAQLKKKGMNYTLYTPPGGESLQEIKERVTAFYNSLFQKHPQETVLLVSHGGAITLLYLYIFKEQITEYEKYHPQNTAVTILEIDDNKKHTVHILNCIKHLE